MFQAKQQLAQAVELAQAAARAAQEYMMCSGDLPVGGM